MTVLRCIWKPGLHRASSFWATGWRVGGIRYVAFCAACILANDAHASPGEVAAFAADASINI